jgi:hypothetical protein
MAEIAFATSVRFCSVSNEQRLFSVLLSSLLQVHRLPKSHGGVSLGYSHLPPKADYTFRGDKIGGGFY